MDNLFLTHFIYQINPFFSLSRALFFRSVFFRRQTLSSPFSLPRRTLASSAFRTVSKVRSMENIVDSLNKAYEKFVLASANVLEAKETAGGQKAAATDAALENFKEKWELFRVACDQAEEFVESVKQRIGSECLVDEATGFTGATGNSGQSAAATSLQPISAVRLEQMSKAVRWLVLELQHGSGVAVGSGHSHSSTGFDTRFSEDSAQ